MGWDLICKSRKKGGLGIGKMIDKNKILLAKWIWCYGNGDQLLWKRVICAVYGKNMVDFRWDWMSSSAMSTFEKALRTLF